MTAAARLKIMVSSTVHGIEDLLDQVFVLLDGVGYEVWMSHKGTIPTWSGNHAFEDCIEAVKRCDLFLCLITPRYGSAAASDLGITHQELNQAITRKVPRWVMVHEKVTFGRTIFRKLGYSTVNARKGFLDSLGFDDPNEFRKMVKRDAAVLDDFRLIDMFDVASRQNVPLADRQGNWVQMYRLHEDVKRYVAAQLGDYDHVVEQVRKQKKAVARKKVKKKVAKKTTRKRLPAKKTTPKRKTKTKSRRSSK